MFLSDIPNQFALVSITRSVMFRYVHFVSTAIFSFSYFLLLGFIHIVPQSLSMYVTQQPWPTNFSALGAQDMHLAQIVHTTSCTANKLWRSQIEELAYATNLRKCCWQEEMANAARLPKADEVTFVWYQCHVLFTRSLKLSILIWFLGPVYTTTTQPWQAAPNHVESNSNRANKRQALRANWEENGFQALQVLQIRECVFDKGKRPRLPDFPHMWK